MRISAWRRPASRALNPFGRQPRAVAATPLKVSMTKKVIDNPAAAARERPCVYRNTQ